MTESGPPDEIRTIQLSANRLRTVLPSVEFPVGETRRRFSGVAGFVIASKLWMLRRWVNAEYQWLGFGRIHLRWVEVRLRCRLCWTRIRLIERLRRRPAAFRSKAMKVTPVKTMT